MKSDEFKKILKPLIEKTVREVLLQEGILSRVVSEVAKGLNQPLVESESRPPAALKKEYTEERQFHEKQKKARIKKLNESAGLGNVFKNIKELPSDDSRSPLSGLAATDAGVDISGIEKLAKGRWKALVGEK